VLSRDAAMRTLFYKLMLIVAVLAMGKDSVDNPDAS